MASSRVPTSSYPQNLSARTALEGIRAQIQDLHTDNIAKLAVRAGALGDVIPLWYGEGDVVTPGFIRDAAKAALDAGSTFYIPNMRGATALNEALSQYQTALHGRSIPVERSTITPGGMQALFLALDMLVDVGTNVVYLEPQWPNIHHAIHVIGGEARPVALRFDGDWKLDLDALFARCDARTRAIFLSTPCNPTGWTATRDELQALLDFSRRTGIWIISDEVYGRLYFEGNVAPSMLQIADDEDRILSINSFSKAWAMTGWRVGWLTHPAGVAEQIGAMTQYTNSGTAAFAQAGAEAALRHGESFVAELKARTRRGLDLTYSALEPLDALMLPPKPKGGMYAFFALKREPDSKAACAHILETSRVGLSPGYLFGDASRSFLRMCVMRDENEIRKALDRMVAALG
ncbi:aminotransferase class I/II-fold pyridoxal phosphate-dependent enzyme [Mesorhizobium sp. NBSH29]|nr:aminotransferase class I/II-fold pyridoxal phosphate-dependent enzyme [Mesorhizobium sp. NBSH29]